MGWLPVAFDLHVPMESGGPMKLKTAKCKVREGNKAPCGQGHRICKGSKVHVGKRWRQSREQITHMNVWWGRAVRVWCSVQEIGHVMGWLPVAFDLHVPMGSCGYVACSCMYLWGLVGVLPVAFDLLWSLVGWLPVAFDLLWSLVGWLP